ncbi:zinc transport system ATP-binding protein [Gracilibacillus halotolerans]|uniref:Zinc transport system ATP-binding protein n=1 Tax=Gracilibacillus halotolerans TaxID=74386 RepID=A0A841RHW7_9BACI|nr:metal ABC transporter ATP-binding protein [Gracilibacillus halotolerans]MBB6513780.1 zinc transport system ATP-binding protein [Gracilibacillus halotolerans]
MSDKIIEIEDVSFQYDYDKTVLSHINFSMRAGDFVGLVGPNGGGKTTLLKLILGLNKANNGTIRIFNTPIQEFKDKNKIAYVSQKANAFNRGFPATVEEVVEMGLTASLGIFKRIKKQHKLAVYEALKKVDMTSYAKENIGNLSGGQQQRVFIARALVSEPELLILDEPTVGVDQQNVSNFFDLLSKLNQQHISLLIVSHDLQAIANHVTNVFFVNKTIQAIDSLEDYPLFTLGGE